MFLTAIVFLAVLSLLVLAHELGHFLMAKKVGVKVEEFGLGYPPRILAKKIGETVYSLNLFPFGGFVRLYGEEQRETGRRLTRATRRAFWAQSKKGRLAIITAGVLANFILAVAAFSLVYSTAGIPTPTKEIKVVGVAPDSPAARAGLKEGDLILRVDDQPVDQPPAGETNLDYFIKLIKEKTGERVKLEVIREEDNPCLEKVLGGGPVVTEEEPGFGFSCQDGHLFFWLAPREEPPEGEGPLGVVVSNIEMKRFPFWQMPFRGAAEGFREAFGWTVLVLSGLGKMLTDWLTAGLVPKDVAGPIGIFQITQGVARSGFLAVCQLIGILSVNLAVINILPFPALDGGRLLFLAYEAVTRRRPKPNFEHWVNFVGMTILIFLIVLVTLNDLARLGHAIDFWGKLSSLWPF